MTEEEKKDFLEISKRIGYKIGTYCNEEEIRIFEKILEDYKYKNNLIQLQRKELETDKQKVIEKLEERRTKNNNRYGQAIDNDEFPEMYEYSGQVQEDDYILEILKGEKNE